METSAASRLVVVSGCSGGGKSTLVAALARRGVAIVPEPGRRIVAEERAAGGTALPWMDAVGFARRLVAVARADLAAAQSRPGLVVFDRGLVDAAAALAQLAGVPVEETLGAARPYEPRVFLAPPWPEIYAGDAGRRHGFADAVAEFERLQALYPRLGYVPELLPKIAIEARADVVLARLAE